MIDIKLKQVTKNYGSTKALKESNLYFTAGIYGIVGPNGAGKSTLLNVMTTILEEDSGVITYKGKNVKNNEKYRDALGYMPQQQSIPAHLSVEHFLFYIASLKGLSRQNAKEQIENLLFRLNLTEHKGKLNKNLSGGMRQRVLIAQALLNDPKVLILDEPTAGLDPIERSKLRDLIVEISSNKIIIITSHIISDIEYIADKIILMKKGSVIKDGTKADLLKNQNVYESLMSEKTFQSFKEQHTIINYTRDKDNYIVRHFEPHINGEKVASTLEDVYLYELS